MSTPSPRYFFAMVKRVLRTILSLDIFLSVSPSCDKHTKYFLNSKQQGLGIATLRYTVGNRGVEQW